MLLRNGEFWDVQDLEITNLGTNREPWRTGVRVMYNNTVYLRPKQDLPLLLFTEWEKGNANGSQFLNNIFFN